MEFARLCQRQSLAKKIGMKLGLWKSSKMRVRKLGLRKRKLGFRKRSGRVRMDEAPMMEEDWPEEYPDEAPNKEMEEDWREENPDETPKEEMEEDWPEENQCMIPFKTFNFSLI